MASRELNHLRFLDLPTDTANSCAALEAMLVPSSSSAFQGSQSAPNYMAGVEALANGRKRPYCVTGEGSEDNTDDDMIVDSCIHQPHKKSRLTSEQVELLEKSFELDNKPAPDRKVQLAKDLNMDPRQVGVWFQNRRARWKTKQLEKEYSMLKHNYNVLKACCEALLQEKECLKEEVCSLTAKLNVGNPNLLESDCTSRCQDSVIPPVLTVETVADHMAIFASAYPQAHYSRMVKPPLVEEDEAYSYNLTPEDQAWWNTGWPDDY